MRHGLAVAAPALLVLDEDGALAVSPELRRIPRGKLLGLRRRKARGFAGGWIDRDVPHAVARPSKPSVLDRILDVGEAADVGNDSLVLVASGKMPLQPPRGVALSFDPRRLDRRHRASTRVIAWRTSATASASASTTAGASWPSRL